MGAQILKDDVICLSGTFPSHKHNDLKELVKGHGGTFSQRMNPSCTHLVITQDDIDGSSTKYKQSLGCPSVRLVSVDWLLECTQGGKRLDETSYALTPSNASTPAAATTTPTASNTRPKRTKRTLDTNANDDTDTAVKDDPPAKKKKASSNNASVKKEPSPSPPKQEETKPKLKIPVDSAAYAANGYRVYINDNGDIYDAALNQANATHNNNKFFILQLLVRVDPNGTEHYEATARWGRVGERGQSSGLGKGSFYAAEKGFLKKFRDKTGISWEERLRSNPRPGKYTFVERNYEEDDEDLEEKLKKRGEKSGDTAEEVEEVESNRPESTLSQPIQQLVGIIFDQQHWHSTMAAMEYDANKLPLGKLSKRTLQSGYQLLKDLSEVLNDPGVALSKHGKSTGQAIQTLSNQYFTIIPHSFGRRAPPVMNNLQYIKKEADLLEALTDMEIANDIMNTAKAPGSTDTVHPLDRHYMGLGMREMTPLESTSTEYHELRQYLQRSYGKTHSVRYKPLNLFRIEREGEHDRYLNSPHANIKNSNRRLLWHGSRTTNYGGILSQGLRIAPPEAPSTGYMFGKGVYFADMSSKSANYCCSFNSDGMGILLLCDVELGDPMLERQSADFDAAKCVKEEGKLATLGKGRTVPAGWKDADCVHPDLQGVLMPDTTSSPVDSDDHGHLMYNEYIVYDVAQVRLRYLLLVDMR